MVGNTTSDVASWINRELAGSRSLGGERSFNALSAVRWKSFANRARLPEPAVLQAVVETVGLVNERWWQLPERRIVPVTGLERIDAHVEAMTPILNSCAEK